MMSDYHIGSLEKGSLAQLASAESMSEGAESRPVFLQPKLWSKAVLSDKRAVSADTKIFTFKLDHSAQSIGLPVGQHLMIRLRDGASQEALIRAYTPISEGTDVAELHVLVKIYYDSPERKGGKMTQALDRLPIGSTAEFKGPVGKFEYIGKGLCTIGGKERRVRRFVMICAGSGITPIFQVLRAVMKDGDDPTTCVVLNGNRAEEDILCKEELDAIAAEDKMNKCKLLYTLSRPPPSWGGLKGRMDKALFEKEVGSPTKHAQTDTMVLVCGPESMERTVLQALESLGWKEEDIVFF
jgi:nitrate reductase (NAD(P)H)